MYVRMTHLHEGPHLETSIPRTDPAHQKRLKELALYATALYAKLVEYGRSAYIPTQEGHYRDLFSPHHGGSSSRVTDDLVQGTLSPEEYANRLFNLLIKIREHEGSIILVVAPIAVTNERDTLRSALMDTRAQWERLLGRSTRETQSPLIVYSWMRSETRREEPDLWPEDIQRNQHEVTLFHTSPQQ
jgi:hypothetical protein